MDSVINDNMVEITWAGLVIDTNNAEQFLSWLASEAIDIDDR